MNPFAHFQALYGHLELSEDDPGQVVLPIVLAQVFTGSKVKRGPVVPFFIPSCQGHTP
jgi:hypothetical protein